MRVSRYEMTNQHLFACFCTLFFVIYEQRGGKNYMSRNSPLNVFP